MQTEVERSIKTIHCNTQAVYTNYLAVEKSTNAICENQKAIAKTAEAISDNIASVERSSLAIEENNKEVEKSLILIRENAKAIEETTQSVEKLNSVMQPLTKAPYFAGALGLILLLSLIIPSLIFWHGIRNLKK